MEIIDSILIKSSPQKVFKTLIFFFRNSENYKLWHKDHIACSWQKGKDFSPGSQLVVEEYLHGKHHRLRLKLLNYEQNNFIAYKFLFPLSLIFSKGFFKIIPKENNTEFVAQLKLKFNGLLTWIFREKIKALKIHMKEEGENMKAFIEKNTHG